MSIYTVAIVLLHLWLVPALFLTGAEWWAMKHGNSDVWDVLVAFFWPVSVPGIILWNRFA